MEDTVTRIYPMVMIGTVVLAAVMSVIVVAIQSRPRPRSVVALGIETIACFAIFFALFATGGTGLNWLFAAIFALVGAALGYVSGRGSKIVEGKKGKPAVKRSIWPALLAGLSYIAVAGAIASGSGGLFSVALLVVLMGAAMRAGATAAELGLATPGGTAAA